MSLTKSATRRLALLSSASLVAAGIAAAGSLGLALAPGAALAQVCSQTQADVNDTAADIVTCTVGTYPTGIQYTAVGELDLTVQTGSNFGTGGVVASAGATSSDPDNLIVRLAGATSNSNVSFNTQAFPKLFDVQSQAGDVLIDLKAASSSFRALQANNAVTTHFAYAVSQNGGDVRVMVASAGNIGIQATGAASIAALEARSVGGGDVTIGNSGIGNLQISGGQNGILASVDGGGDLNIDLGFNNFRGSSQGRLYGIRAQASGTGNLTISGDASTNSSAGLYGIHATTGTGLLTITGAGSSASAGGTGVYISAGGDVVFTGTASGGQYGIYLANVQAGTTTTLNLTNSPTGGTAGIFAQGSGEVLIDVLSTLGTLGFNFNGMSAPVDIVFDEGTAWRPSGAYTVPDGNFLVSIAADGALVGGVSGGGAGLETPTVVTFTDPDMSITNAGYIVVGPGAFTVPPRDLYEAEFRLVGLNEFRHSGTITLGSAGTFATGASIQGVRVEETDGWYDDMFVFQDGTWIGEGGRILFDADFNRSQTTCTREAVTFDFGAADCVRIVDSTVEGVTYIDLYQTFAGDRGRLTQAMMDDGILLIDAPGSTVTAENFVLDPNTLGYNAGGIDKGLYQYVLLFDEDASQFKLFPTLTGAAYQLPMAATAAHDLWRTTTGSWLNRQADLRGGLQEGFGGGIWLRASGERADREVAGVSTLGGIPYSVDNTHRQDTYAITGGVDILSGGDGDTAYVVGLMAGYGHTDVEYEASGNTQAMDGWTGGVYAGLVVGGLFVDAVVNANNVIIDTDAPGFNFSPEGTILSSRLISLGGQVEAGWRLPFAGGFFAEPLASVSYVRSRMDDLVIVPDDGSRPGLEVSFEDPSSLRAGLGARVGMDRDFGTLRTQVSLLGRMWNDLEGQNTASIHNLAFPDDPEIRVTDDFSGQFNELGLGASVYSAGGVVSGFVNLGGKFGDDYEAQTASAGVRVAW